MQTTSSTIGGGAPNTIGTAAKFSTISGGGFNTCEGLFSTVAGGDQNLAAGNYSFAVGHLAQAIHPGAFVWADSIGADVASTANNQFTARASGGVVFYSTPDLSSGVSLAPGGGSWASLSGASNISVGGYDTVAFFTDKKPVNGDPGISATYQDATYIFASKEHKELFEAAPEKYAPQCGGYCAFGVSVGALFPVDISTWQVRDGKLYLNLNKAILKKFNADFDANVAKADKNWPTLVAKHGK